MENQEKTENTVETTETYTPVTEPSTYQSGTTSTFMDVINRNRKTLTYVLGGVMVAILAFIGYRVFYLAPLEEEAQATIFQAQRYFEADSFNLALNGDGKNIGFLDIVSDYSGTRTANIASYYAGISLLNTGKYEDAIDYLEDFDSDSKILNPLALGAIGDAYSQLKDYENAASYYMKAAKEDDNEFTAPRFYKKAGVIYEHLGNFDDALDAYKIVKEKYGKTNTGNDIDKYIARASAAAGTME